MTEEATGMEPIAELDAVEFGDAELDGAAARPERSPSPSRGNVSASLIDELLAEAEFEPKSRSYRRAKAGVQALLQHSLEPGTQKPHNARHVIDSMIADIDARLSAQLNAILHHPRYKELESAWAGLYFAIQRIDFKENIIVEMVNISKEDLAADLEDAPDFSRSGFFALAYSREYGQFGGQPYGVICGNYEFGPSAPDVYLLSQITAVAAVSHAPFISNASPRFFGSSDFSLVPTMKDLDGHFESPQFQKWRAFRDNPDACYVGLCMPRFLARLPFEESLQPVRRFNFSEDLSAPEHCTWAYASNAFVTRVAESFARHRWSPNIVGAKSGGTVRGMLAHPFEALGKHQLTPPTEVVITERREYELGQHGFMPLVYRQDIDGACFFSANSVQRPKTFADTEEGRAASINYRLGTQLPYMFVVCRLAHYVKVLQREQLGETKNAKDIEDEINKWLLQYTADVEDPSPSVKARKPLRRARVKVEEVEGQRGWFSCSLEVQPHIKHMGVSFTLDLVGRLDT